MAGIGITFRSITSWPGKATSSSARKRSRFDSSWSKTVDLLERELGFIDAKNVVLEADCDQTEIRLDGQLRANAKLRGPGVVISFDSAKGPLRFPCDRFTDWQANVRGIALGLESLRAVDRYGVTQHAEQYKGWTALPDKSKEVQREKERAAFAMRQKAYDLDIEPPTQAQLIGDPERRRTLYRAMASILHPDRRGSDQEFKNLQDQIAVLDT